MHSKMSSANILLWPPGVEFSFFPTKSCLSSRLLALNTAQVQPITVSTHQIIAETAAVKITKIKAEHEGQFSETTLRF